MIRVLLADDEQPARERLRELLRAVPDLEIVGEAAVPRSSSALPSINTLWMPLNCTQWTICSSR